MQLTAKCFIKSLKSWKSISFAAKFLKLCVVQCYYMYLTIFRQEAKYKIDELDHHLSWDEAKKAVGVFIQFSAPLSPCAI